MPAIDNAQLPRHLIYRHPFLFGEERGSSFPFETALLPFFLVRENALVFFGARVF